MKKRFLFLILVFSFVLIGCTNKLPVPEPLPEPVNEETNIVVEEATEIPEELPPIEEAEVQEPKCSREFSPQFNAGPYYSGPLFDAHFHMPMLIDFSKIGGHGEGQYADHGSDPITDHVLGKEDRKSVV